MRPSSHGNAWSQVSIRAWACPALNPQVMCGANVGSPHKCSRPSSGTSSAAELVPELDRLHLCGEPTLAPHITCAFKAGHAHARIDTWDHALPWLLNRIEGDKQ